MKPIVSVIAAYTRPDSAYGIGESHFPWPIGGLPGDLQRFFRHTTNAPEERVNLLIGGKNTFLSMSNVRLGDKRRLVGVSSSVEPGNGYGHNRSFVRSIEDALRLAKEMSAYRVIFVGGEAFWLHGINIADEAHLTIAHKTCKDRQAIRLTIPLHIIAERRGMSLTRCDECIASAGLDAWANCEAQVWTMES